MAAKPITVKLVVDTTADKVVFAESDEEFVDVLISFLTLPLGVIVRLLGKKSSIRCVDNLYSSVRKLDAQYLMSKRCRPMLLRPRNAAIRHCKKLRINLDNQSPTNYYRCQSKKCDRISYFGEPRCVCGKIMGTTRSRLKLVDGGFGGPARHGEVFVKVARFAISDDLVIAPAWDTTYFLERLHVPHSGTLEERNVTIDRAKVLQILKCSFLSDTPLTDVLLREECLATPMEIKHKHRPHLALSSDSVDLAPKNITLTLVLKNRRLLYAKAKHDFVDLLFSFLTFPMGSIQRKLAAKSSLPCMDNLYEGAVYLSSTGLFVEKCEELIINPKLPMHYGCKYQLIRIEEEALQYYGSEINNRKCVCYVLCLCVGYVQCLCLSTKFSARCPCKNRLNLKLTLQDPKKSNREPKGRGYLRSSAVYMVTDELVVTPFSIISGVSHHIGAKGRVEEIEIEIGEEEALELLRACLTSKTPLTDALLPIALQAQYGSLMSVPFSAKKKRKICPQ